MRRPRERCGGTLVDPGRTVESMSGRMAVTEMMMSENGVPVGGDERLDALLLPETRLDAYDAQVRADLKRQPISVCRL